VTRSHDVHLYVHFNPENYDEYSDPEIYVRWLDF